MTKRTNTHEKPKYGHLRPNRKSTKIILVYENRFTFSLKYNKVNPLILKGKRAPTKRRVLRTLMSVCDLLGLIAHFLVFVKTLLQQMWRAKTDCDEPIPSCKHFEEAVTVLGQRGRTKNTSTNRRHHECQ